ncbi:MAG TPA: DUF2282 domain-containing protein [Gammaproteobacteria bacterium]|nr:DUF2282 domain-containing protein [Gammaproteobacteria bacterium]
MTYKDAVIQFMVASILVLNMTQALAATPATSQKGMEKCYGISKAGMNDCQTANGSCAGSAVKDHQRDAFIFLPKGICNRIVGGELTAK